MKFCWWVRCTKWWFTLRHGSIFCYIRPGTIMRWRSDFFFWLMPCGKSHGKVHSLWWGIKKIHCWLIWTSLCTRCGTGRNNLSLGWNSDTRWDALWTRAAVLWPRFEYLYSPPDIEFSCLLVSGNSICLWLPPHPTHRGGCLQFSEMWSNFW
jgi:hypothetical protein